MVSKSLKRIKLANGLEFRLVRRKLNHHYIGVLEPNRKISYDESVKLAKKLLGGA